MIKTQVLKAILVDDESSNSEVLQYEIEKISHDIEVIASYDDPVVALKALKKEKPDLLFLDIAMPKLSGFDLLDLLDDRGSMKVVFVTAFNEYAIKAFEYFAVDYLLKPISRERLSIALEKIIRSNRKLSNEDISDISKMVNSEKSFSDKLIVPIKNGYEVLKTKDIIRCEAYDNYTTIYLDDTKLLVSKTLKHFDDILSDQGFFRVHQSHLINLSYVDQLIKSDGGHVSLSDGSKVPISRSKKNILLSLFKSNSV